MKLQEQIPQTITLKENVTAETTKYKMDIQEDFQLRDVHIDPVVRFVDEYVGTATELRVYSKSLKQMQSAKIFNKPFAAQRKNGSKNQVGS